MARRPRKRRRRHANGADEEGPDRFTHLNDDLLRIIVSLLPTRSAASLASVSRHFRAQVPPLLDRLDSLNLHEPNFPVHLQHAPPTILRRLTIAPHRLIPPSSFLPLLKSAAQHGVSELSIRLTRRARVPKNVLAVRSLTVLCLDSCALPGWSDVACPCLRTLKLHGVAIHQVLINKILASASRLETLEMVYCTGLGTGKRASCTLESSSLRNLVFRPPLKQEVISIRASGLRTVTLYARARTTSLELAPAPEVRKAYLHIANTRIKLSSKLRQFMDAGTRLYCLTLRGEAMNLLSSVYEDIPKLNVTFQDLRILSVTLNISREEDFVFLLKLLESCPNLQNFTISAGASYDGTTDFTDLEERLQNIPCLTSTLVQFNFRGFRPGEYQKQLIVFMLTQATNLKKVGVEFEKGYLADVKEILSVRKAPIERTSSKYASYYIELDYS